MINIESITKDSFGHIRPTNKFVENNRIIILKGLKNDKSIIITKPDKGREVMVLNKHEYIKRLNVLINETKFKFNEDCFKYI